MSTLPCPRCGSKKTNGTFCTDCLRELSPLVRKLDIATIAFCEECKSAKLGGAWKPIPVQDAIERAVGSALHFAAGSKIESVEIAEPELIWKAGYNKKIPVLAVITGKAEDTKEFYEEDYDVPLQYLITRCPACAKKGTSYYEGILQIRNENKAIRKAVYTYIAEHEAKGLHLARAIEQPTGMDYYLSDHRAVGQLAQHLHAQYGGELKINAQHFSEDKVKGKILYRTNAYLEIPEYLKGDVISKDDDYYYILGVSRKVTAENLRTGEQESFPYRKGETRRLAIKSTTISNLSPIEVLHPDTFQSVVPENSKYAPAELDMDRKVSVAIDKEHVFLIMDSIEKDAHVRKRKRQSQKVSKRKD